MFKKKIFPRYVLKCNSNQQIMYDILNNINCIHINNIIKIIYIININNINSYIYIYNADRLYNLTGASIRRL